MLQRAKSGDYVVHGNDLNLDCVIALSFGFRKVGDSIEPGISNQDLAGFIYERYSKLPKILQSEVADAMPSSTQDIYRIEKHRQPGVYLDSSEVVLQAKEIMDKKGWAKAVLIAHPNHMPRVDALCQKIGINTVAPSGLRSIRFEPKSEQEWTRNKVTCGLNEEQAIVSYRQRGLL